MGEGHRARDDLIMFDATASAGGSTSLIGSCPAQRGRRLTITWSRSLRKSSLPCSRKVGRQRENQFFEDALHNLLVNAVELVKLAGPKYPSVLSICAYCAKRSHQPRAAQDPNGRRRALAGFFCKRPREQRRADEELKATTPNAALTGWMTSLISPTGRAASSRSCYEACSTIYGERSENFSRQHDCEAEDTFAGKS